MILGLERGVVKLVPHQDGWRYFAESMIKRLQVVFPGAPIEHVGSTAIRGIHAKPIIDIVVGVDDLGAVAALAPNLEAQGFTYKEKGATSEQRYAVLHDSEMDKRLANIHIVIKGGEVWHDYIDFRDYLNAMPKTASEYETLKLKLAEENPIDPGREKYLAGKDALVQEIIEKARVWQERRHGI